MSTPPGSPITLDLAEGGTVTVTVFHDAPDSPTSFRAPPAPRRPSRLERRKGPYWRRLKSIRPSLLFYTPEDVEEIDEIGTLKNLFKKYYFKNAKPRCQGEWLYCSAMLDAILRKLN